MNNFIIYFNNFYIFRQPRAASQYTAAYFLQRCESALRSCYFKLVQSKQLQKEVVDALNKKTTQGDKLIQLSFLLVLIIVIKMI